MGVDESNIEELGDIETHTYYMYKNGYTESKVLTTDTDCLHPEV